MTAVLELIRAELSRVRRWVDALEQSEALLAALYEADGHPVPTGEPPAPVARRRARLSRVARANPSRDALLECIFDNEPISRGQLLAKLGGSPKAMDRKLKGMLELGLVAASGHPRLYTRPTTPPQAVNALAAEIAPTAARRPEVGRYPVYDALRETESATTTQLMARTGLTSSVVFAQARELTRLRLVAFRGEASNRVWHLRPVAAT